MMSLETLFRAVYEAPEVDTPKHVLADALQRAGTVHEQWEKGFLVECTVRLSGTTVDCEAWATVRTLHVFAQPELPGELASPHFGALRAVFVHETYQLTDEARTLLDALEARGVRVTRG